MSCGLENCGLELAPLNGYDPVAIERGMGNVNRFIRKLAELLLGGQIVRDDDGDIVRDDDGDIVRDPIEIPGIAPPIVFDTGLVVDDPMLAFPYTTLQVLVERTDNWHTVELYMQDWRFIGVDLVMRLGEWIVVAVGGPLVVDGKGKVVGDFGETAHVHYGIPLICWDGWWDGIVGHGTSYPGPDPVQAAFGQEKDDDGGHHHHEARLGLSIAWLGTDSCGVAQVQPA